jgi:hypothetical protein
MTATDELRRLLDERGVEWQSKPELIISGIEKGTEFDAADGRLVRAVEALDGTICLSHITPEQAIAVTLGTGTCRDVADAPQYGDKTRFECSECGYEYSAVGGFGCDYGDEPDFRFCPNCGRRVVEVDE